MTKDAHCAVFTSFVFLILFGCQVSVGVFVAASAVEKGIAIAKILFSDDPLKTGVETAVTLVVGKLGGAAAKRVFGAIKKAGLLRPVEKIVGKFLAKGLKQGTQLLKSGSAAGKDLIQQAGARGGKVLTFAATSVKKVATDFVASTKKSIVKSIVKTVYVQLRTRLRCSQPHSIGWLCSLSPGSSNCNV